MVSTIWSGVQNFFQSFIKLNTELDGMEHGIKATASFFKDQLPGGQETIEKINNCFIYINILPWANKVYNIKEMAKANVSKPIKFMSLTLLLFAKTSKYLWSVPPLLSSHPWILTATAIAKPANKLFQGMGLGLSVVSMNVESADGLSCIDYLKMIKVSSIAYIIIAPILFATPPVLPAIVMTANVLSGGFFLKDMLEFGAGIAVRVSNAVLEKMIFSEILNRLDLNLV